MEEIILARDDYLQITNALEFILAKLAREEGRAASYAARRDEFKILQFPTQQKKPEGSGEQPNGDTLATSEKENQMRISVDIKGISINRKPRRDGRYQGYAVRDGEKRYFYGKTYHEVEQKIAQYWKEGLTEKQNNEIKQKNSPTFGEFVDKWIKLYKTPKLKPSSLESIRYSMKHALKKFADRRLSSITSDDLQEMLIGIEGTRIRQQCQTNVSQVFRKAFLQGIIKRNPCEAVEIDPHKSKKVKALTIEETEIFLNASKGTKYDLLNRFVLATGVRIGEALALHRADVDFVRHEVSITKDVVFIGGERIEQPPKTEAAIRTLPIPEGICNELADLTGEYLFPYTYNAVRIAIKKIAIELNIKVTEHKLRHTYATRLEEAGIPPKLTQYFMGHASIKMTKDGYTDAQRTYAESVFERVREAFEPKKE